MFLTVRKRLVSGSSPERQTKQNCVDGQKKRAGHRWRQRWRTREVLDGELAVFGEGNVSAHSS